MSLKRKQRDLVADKEGPVWQNLATQLNLDPERFQILESRGRDRAAIVNELRTDFTAFQRKYWDGRLCGNTFLEDGGPDTMRTGALQLGIGVSIAPIDLEYSTWTNKAGVQADKDRGMAPQAHKVVAHGLYAMPFHINPTAARKSGCTAQDVQIFLELLKHVYPHTRSVCRTMVEILHAHVFTHNNQCGSCSAFALLNALMPKRIGDPTQPSSSLTDYKIPQWNDIAQLPIKAGSTKTFSDCGTYQDYAF